MVEAHPGTYTLLLRCALSRELQIGRLGQLTFRSGFYLYVGSAFGPGGIEARVGHHLKPVRRPHWHIDYLRPIVALDEIWYSYDRQRREHQWADALVSLGTVIPHLGFGASDCRCSSHLFFSPTRPSYTEFCQHIQTIWPDHAPIQLEPVRPAGR
ncbi:MAG: GIY-YIG nuclease family protein [Trueperaceae bacterium]|nr:MAG: GIY-YIG nuclease family protein [Trueperaceae bacterium]